jgi:hypothetical protein
VNLNDLYEEGLMQVEAQARHYLRTVRERHAGVLPAAIEGLRAFGGPLPARGESPLAILKLLDSAGSPTTVASMGGRFFGGVIGGALPVSVAAHWLADAWDQNACLYDISPVAAHLEDVVLSWILDLLGLSRNCAGAFVTGTQMADVTALAAARGSVLRNVGWDVERDGLFSAPPVTVIVGEEVHATMLKALALLGFGKGRVQIVPADGQGRMKPSPSQFRRSGEIKKSKICKELFPQDEYGLPMSAEEKRAAFPVRLIDVPERQVAYVRVTNAFDMDRVLAALTALIGWAKSQDVFSQGILFGNDGRRSTRDSKASYSA